MSPAACALVEAHWPWACRVVRGWWPVERDEMLSATGELLCRIAQRYVDEAPTMPFRAYAVRKLRSGLIDDWRRRNGRRADLRERRRPVELDADPVAHERGYAQVDDADLAVRLLRCARRDAVQAQVLHAAGWRFGDIAAVWGVSESRVCQVAAHARGAG